MIKLKETILKDKINETPFPVPMIYQAGKDLEKYGKNLTPEQTMLITSITAVCFMLFILFIYRDEYKYTKIIGKTIKSISNSINMFLTKIFSSKYKNIKNIIKTNKNELIPISKIIFNQIKKDKKVEIENKIKDYINNTYTRKLAHNSPKADYLKNVEDELISIVYKSIKDNPNLYKKVIELDKNL